LRHQKWTKPLKILKRSQPAPSNDTDLCEAVRAAVDVWVAGCWPCWFRKWYVEGRREEPTWRRDLLCPLFMQRIRFSLPACRTNVFQAQSLIAILLSTLHLHATPMPARDPLKPHTRSGSPGPSRAPTSRSFPLEALLLPLFHCTGSP
jgi:hypothetical protein